MIDVIEDARFNLAILYLRRGNSLEALNLLQEYQPYDITQIILKAAVFLEAGQETSDMNLVENAIQMYTDVASMNDTVDTVAGRQVLATTKFVTGEFEECIQILNTMESLLDECDEFNYNKGMSFAALSRWGEAEKFFLKVKNADYIKNISYTSWLARCYIRNKKTEDAWQLYQDASTPEEAKTLLLIISTECYSIGEFYFAMKSYEVLSKVDFDPSYREGLIASSVGVFRGILSQKETADHLGDVIINLSNEPEAADVLQVIQNYMETTGEFDQFFS